MSLVKLLFALVALSFYSTSYAYQTCDRRDIGQDEVITYETSGPYCPSTGLYNVYVYNHIANVPSNSNGEKFICAGSGRGYNIPSGYTLVRSFFTYNVCHSLTINVIVPNHPPNTNGIGFTTYVNTTMSGAATTTDPDNDQLTYTLSSGSGRNGATVSLNSQTGDFTYTPATDFVGTDRFTVIARDRYNAIGYIFISVRVLEGVPPPVPVNLPPTIYLHDINCLQNTTCTFTMAASDPEGDAFTLGLTTTNFPEHGTLTSRLSPTNDYLIFTYNPGTDYYGEDKIEMWAEDSHGNRNTVFPPLTVVPLDDDNDGLPDTYEAAVGLDNSDPNDALQDPDNDGLTNLEEFTLQTGPFNEDTDGDLIDDGFESRSSVLDPLNSADSLLDGDGDGYSNYDEYLADSDPADPNITPFNVNLAWLIPVITLILLR